MPPGLYLIILNWNLKQDTIECIDSLLQADFREDQIIVVDNGSTDGSAGAIRARYSPLLTLLELPANLGYAGGINRGIEFALERGAEWVFLLNNDTVVAPDLKSELTKIILTGNRRVISAPLLLGYSARDVIDHAGDRQVFGTLITRPLHRGKSASGLPDRYSVDFLIGCALLIPGQVFQTVGLFDTRFFMYAEDVDFCWRCRKAGIGLEVITRARIWHKLSLSTQKIPNRQRFWQIRNQAWFYRLHASRWQIPPLVIFSLFRAVLLALQDVFRGHPGLAVPLAQGWVRGWLYPIPPSPPN